jgi:hypothetical protein
MRQRGHVLHMLKQTQEHGFHWLSDIFGNPI